MPLSIPFLVYAFITGVSMRLLSMSGVIPAMISAFALIGVCIWFGKKTGCDKGGKPATAGEILAAFKEAWPALLMPIMIIGGIWTGLFTPTEAAAIAVVYGVIISIFLYKDLKWRDLPEIMLKSFQTSAVVMLVIGATGCLAWLITVEQVAAQLADWVQAVAHQQWLFLLMLNVCLFLVGIFIEPLPAMLLTIPLFLPVAQAFRVDLVHLGVVVTANLAIALYTPPVGGTLFVAASLAKAGIGAITKHLIPMMTVTFIVVLIVTYIPATTKVILWLFNMR